MIIAVVGAWGFTGGHIAAEALSRGHRVIGVSRRPVTDERPGVVIRQGSLFEQSLLESVAAESDVVVLAVPAVSESGSLAEAVPNLLRTLGVHRTRLGVVGGAGSLLVEPAGPAMFDLVDFPAAYREGSKSQGRVLSALRAESTGADWFYLSPAGAYGKHTPGQRTGRYRTGDDVLVCDESGRSYISGADYAVAFLDEIETPTHHRTRFTVAY